MAPPTAKTTTILLVGATGFLGKKVLAAFQQEAQKLQTSSSSSSHLLIKASSRRPQKQQGTNKEEGGAGVQWVVADMMQPATLDAALGGVDVVVTTANGYMKESITADFEGNRNLVEAAARAKVKRFVLLSIAACQKAQSVPHFWAKRVAEEALEKSGMPYVAVRAPAFLDQEQDIIANNAKAGRLVALGDANVTSFSYTTTHDLAHDMVKAALYPKDDINFKKIETGWAEGPMTQRQIAQLIDKVSGKPPLSVYTLPWFVLRAMGTLFGLFSPLVHDMTAMFLFMRTQGFVSDLTAYKQFLGTPPAAEEAVRRWAAEKGLVQAAPK